MLKDLQELQQKIISAVPSIVELKFGCEINRLGEYYNPKKLREYFVGMFSDKISIVRETKLGTWLPFEVPKELFEKWTIIGRPILLEDVLIALSIKSGQYLTEKGKFVFINDDGNYEFEWLLNTPLHLQSEETISAINKLIK